MKNEHQDHAHMSKAKSFGVAMLAGVLLPFVAAADGSLTVQVDASRALAHPFVKSKLGFARAVTYELLPESISAMDIVQPRAFCSEVDFDTFEAVNYALQPNPFTSATVNGPYSANPWLLHLQDELTRRHINIYYQLIGAPKPFQASKIARPAIHPTPTDIDKSAQWTASWVKPYLQTNAAINWGIWNEPTHTLRGKPTEEAARDMVSIYKAYRSRLNSLSYDDSIGLSGIIAGSMKLAHERKGSGSFNEVLFDGIFPNNAPDFYAMNIYRGRLDELVIHLNSLLRQRNSQAPLLLSQFAPEEVTRKNTQAESNQTASLYLDAYDHIVQEPSIEHVCMSYWAGGSKAFAEYDEEHKHFVAQPNLLALSLYQQLPLWRVATKLSGNEDVAVLAGRFGARLGMLLMNHADHSVPVSLAVGDSLWANKPAQVKLLASQHNNAIETHVLKPEPGQSPHWDLGAGDLALILWSADAQAESVPEFSAHYIRSDMYVDRSVAETEQRAFASYDQINNSFLLDLPSGSAVAHASARLNNAPAQMDLHWELAPGTVAEVPTSCLLIAAQRWQTGHVVASNAYGSADVLSRLQALGQLTEVKKSELRALPVQKNGSNMLSTIEFPASADGREVRVDIAAQGCRSPLQLQATLSNHESTK